MRDSGNEVMYGGLSEVSGAGNYQLPILLVDHNNTVLDFLKTFLLCKGFSNIVTIDDSRSVLQFLENHDVAVIVLDLMMPKLTGQSLLKLLVAKHPTVSIIILSAQNQLEPAIDCMKQGACDYLTKPLDYGKFLASIDRALELRSLKREVFNLERTPAPEPVSLRDDFPYIITRNATMRDLLRYVEMIAPTRKPLLIMGETGVGKELFARALHQASKRTGPLVSINVAGLDNNMFSDTLFGHKKGTYTGAEADREGLVSKAAQGTLFLDEIGDLSELAQVKLLRLVQEQEYYRLGCDTPSKSEARIVVATNRDLKMAMNQGTFRKDLYYRLFAHKVCIPPLRNRQDDIPLLLDSFICCATQSLGKGATSYPQELITLLSEHPFLGNVRELQAMVFEAVVKNSSGKLGQDQFKEIIRRERWETIKEPGPSSFSGYSGGISFVHLPTFKEAEIALINKALKLAKSNQGIAASMLGISRQALNRRLQLMEE